MKLISLQLNNFRQFYGTSKKIDFSYGERNVTVLHGGNGSGKTALLNAITWTLYESLTPGFLLPDQIVNKRAIREADVGDTVNAWVELIFEHDDYRYTMRRTTEVVKTSADDSWETKGSLPPTLYYQGPDGEQKPSDRVADVIGRILPQDLHTYFFFDGERIERIVKPSEGADIGNATKKLLGVEILERAENHLGSVKKDLVNELKNIGDPETVQDIEEKGLLEEKRERLNERQIQLDKNIEGETQRKQEIGKTLRDLDEVKNIQIRRDQLLNDEQAHRESLKQNRRHLARVISSRGYSVFLEEAVTSFNNLIEDLRQKGELPAGIKKQFVADLLAKQQCICGRPLDIDSDARVSVEEWLSHAGLGDVEEKAMRMGGELKKLEEMIPDFWEQLDQIQRKRLTDRQELSRIELELDDIKEKLRSSPREDISKLQTQWDNAQTAIDDAKREQIENEVKIGDLTSRIEKLEDKIIKHKANEERQRLAQKRINAAADAISRIVEVRALLEKEFRRSLLSRIRSIFNSMSYTPYIPELTDSYSLYLVESAGGVPLRVAASQGESQILSLAFIGSVIEEAKAFHAKREGLPGPDSSTYPIVMDSPFGSLDSTYRHQIADHMPDLANQVIVLVSNTQWRVEVEQSLSRKCGRAYLLKYFTPKDAFEKETIDINGVTQELVCRSPNEFEYTEIIEV